MTDGEIWDNAVNVAGNLYYTNGVIDNTVNVAGDVTVGTDADGGTGTIVLNGTLDQDITLSGVTAGKLCNLTINKASGDATLEGTPSTLSIGATGLGTLTITDTGDEEFPNFDKFDLNGKTIDCGAFTHTEGTVANTAGGGAIRAVGTVTGVAGNWTGGTLTFNKSTGDQEWRPGGVTWNDIIVNLTQANENYDDLRVYLGAATINGNLTITDGEIWDNAVNVAGNLYYTNGVIDNTVNLSGNLTVGTDADGGTGTIVLEDTGDQVIDFDGETAGKLCSLTINKDSGDTTITGTPTSLTLGATGGGILTITKTGTGVFDLSGKTIDCGALTHTAGTVADSAGGGVVRVVHDTGAVGTAGSWTGGTLIFNHPDHSQEWEPGNVSWNNVIINIIHAAGYDRLRVDGAAATINGDLTITDGEIWDNTANVAGDFTLTNGEVTNVINLSGNLTVGTDAEGGTGTIYLVGNGTGTLEVIGTPPTDLEINRPGGLVTMISNVSLPGDLTITDGTLYANGYNPASATFTNNGILRLQGGEDLSGLTLDTDTGGVEYVGDAIGTDYASLIYGNTYNDLIINSTTGSIFTPNADITIGGDLTIQNGVLDISTDDVDVTGTFYNNGTLLIDGAKNVAYTSLTNDIDSGTVSYDGGGDYSAQDLIFGDTYFNLTISGAGTFAHSNALDIDNNFTQSAGTFEAPDANMNVARDFNIAGGTFNANSGAVIFDDVTKTSNIYGTTFNDLTIIAGKTVGIASGATEEITGAFTAVGTLGNEITLQRVDGDPDDQWNIKPMGTWDIQYVNVSDSANTNGDSFLVTSADNCVNGGNTTNWFPGDSDDPITPNIDRILPPTTPKKPGPPDGDGGGRAPKKGGDRDPIIIPDDPINLDGEDENHTDDFSNWDEAKKKYNCNFRGKYKTVVIVYEGKVAVAPYDENGPKFDDGVMLTPGQETQVTAEAGRLPVHKKGGDHHEG